MLIKSHYPHASGKITVIPNGVEEDVFGYKWLGADGDYMMYAGRIEKYKRLEVAVDLARELGLRLLVVGRGAHRERLRRYARRRGVSLELLDPQPRPDYLRLLAGARYAVNPSRHETYSIFAAESLAMGVPAVITPEVAENLAAEQKPLRDGLVVAVRAAVPAWRDVIQKYLDLYRP